MAIEDAEVLNTIKTAMEAFRSNMTYKALQNVKALGQELFNNLHLDWYLSPDGERFREALDKEEPQEDRPFDTQEKNPTIQ